MRPLRIRTKTKTKTRPRSISPRGKLSSDVPEVTSHKPFWSSRKLALLVHPSVTSNVRFHTTT